MKQNNNDFFRDVIQINKSIVSTLFGYHQYITEIEKKNTNSTSTGQICFLLQFIL